LGDAGGSRNGMKCDIPCPKCMSDLEHSSRPPAGARVGSRGRRSMFGIVPFLEIMRGASSFSGFPFHSSSVCFSEFQSLRCRGSSREFLCSLQRLAFQHPLQMLLTF
jgi:hypothetical protein